MRAVSQSEHAVTSAPALPRELGHNANKPA